MPSAWIEHVKKVQKDKGITYREAMSEAKKTYKRKQPEPEQNQDGEGLRESIKKFLGTRPRNVKRLLKSHGDKVITGLEVCRTPIDSKIKIALDLISGGKISSISQKYNYDQIYHLFLIMKFQDGSRYSIEKNEIVKTKKNPKARPTSFCLSTSANTTFKKLVEAGERKDGANHWRYSAHLYSCQRFLKSMLNGIGITKFNNLLNQKADRLIVGKTRKIAQAVTDVGATASRVKEEVEEVAEKAKHVIEKVKEKVFPKKEKVEIVKQKKENDPPNIDDEVSARESKV